MIAFKKLFPFKVKLGILLFMIVLLISSFLGLFQYIIMRNSLEDGYEQSKKLMNDRIINVIRNADYVNMLLEKPIEERSRRILEAVSKQYDAGQGINFDLEPFISGTDNMNLYVIDSNNTVIKATDQTDIGLNFSGFPDFTAYLSVLRYNGVFSAPRISLSINQKNISKFCYMPSSDGRYIFETGSLIEYDKDYFSGIGFDDFEEKILEENSFVDRIILYDYQGNSYKKDASGNSLKIQYSYSEYFKEALQSLKQVEVIHTYNGRKAYYVYLPYEILNAQGANERNVVEIIYNDYILEENLKSNMKIILFFVAIGAVISASIGFFVAGILTKPIKEITDGVVQVSKGNLSYQFKLKINDEFSILGNQFNKMTYEIRKLLDERYKFENDLQQKNQEVFSQKEEISALYEETTALNEELESFLLQNQNSYFETVKALANAIDEKDPYTGGHCQRVMEYSLLIAKTMGLNQSELEDLKFGSILHDIGKIGISENILNKDGKLTDEEYGEIKKHPEKGNHILKELNFMKNCRRIIYEHHERIDGKGYPNGLREEEIDLLARIVCVADSYDAMTSSRPYRDNTLTKEQAIEELIRNKGTQFDCKVVDSFIAALNGI